MQMMKGFLKIIFTIFFMLNGISLFQLFLHAQIKEDNFKQEMEALKFGNNLIANINSNRDYVAILNQLLSRSEYLKYPNYLDMLAWLYTYVGHDNKGIELGDMAFPIKKRNQDCFIDI